MDLENFTIEKNTPLNLDFQRLLNSIDLQALQFMINKTHSECISTPILVNGVTMSGKSDKVRQSLKEIRATIFSKIIEYSESEESIDTKLETLGAIEIALAEKLFYWEITFPELYEGPLHFDLIDINNEIRVVTMLDIIIPNEIRIEIIEHHNVRLSFINLIKRQIEIQQLKIRYQFDKPIDQPQNKELELAEIWLGLETMGYFSELNQNEKAQKRKTFYQLFGVVDRNYNYKSNQINQRKIPRFLFINKMLEDLMKKYEK
jgi:hypothetical protein